MDCEHETTMATGSQLNAKSSPPVPPRSTLPHDTLLYLTTFLTLAPFRLCHPHACRLLFGPHSSPAPEHPQPLPSTRPQAAVIDGHPVWQRLGYGGSPASVLGGPEGASHGCVHWSRFTGDHACLSRRSDARVRRGIHQCKTLTRNYFV